MHYFESSESTLIMPMRFTTCFVLILLHIGLGVASFRQLVSNGKYNNVASKLGNAFRHKRRS